LGFFPHAPGRLEMGPSRGWRGEEGGENPHIETDNGSPTSPSNAPSTLNIFLQALFYSSHPKPFSRLTINSKGKCGKDPLRSDWNLTID
jgi:hypothetical protein